MTRAPRLTSAQIVRVLHGLGFRQVRQRGSHLYFQKPGHPTTVTVPMHHKTLPIGTLQSILHLAGLSIDDLIRLLRE